jgi:hypothetical protein
LKKKKEKKTKMGRNSCDSCVVSVALLVTFAVFAVLGGCLMGLANPPNFPTPQFIAGFSFIMVDAIMFFVFVSYFWIFRCC